MFKVPFSKSGEKYFHRVVVLTAKCKRDIEVHIAIDIYRCVLLSVSTKVGLYGLTSK